jgi:hypothetical protein
MNALIGLASVTFSIVTMPIWVGAMAAALTFGIHLLLNAPWLLVLIFLAPFILRKFA